MINFRIETVTNGRWRENCYIVEKDSDALIIDPGGDAPRILDVLMKAQASPLAILLTHAHYDHVGAAAELKERFSIPLYLSRGDKRLLGRANLFRAIFESDEVIRIPDVDAYFEDESLPLVLGAFCVQVFFAPGHTQGGVCFGIDDVWFTGDTLLPSLVGRTDLPGANAEALDETLRRFVQLPGVDKIYPGHGKPSTMRDELRNNKPLQEVLSRTQSAP